MLRDFDIGNYKFDLVQVMMLNRLAQQHHMQYNKKICKTLQSWICPFARASLFTMVSESQLVLGERTGL